MVPQASVTFWIIGWPLLLLGFAAWLRLLFEVVLRLLQAWAGDDPKPDKPTPLIGIAMLTAGWLLSGYSVAWSVIAAMLVAELLALAVLQRVEGGSLI